MNGVGSRLLNRSTTLSIQEISKIKIIIPLTTVPYRASRSSNSKIHDNNGYNTTTNTVLYSNVNKELYSYRDFSISRMFDKFISLFKVQPAQVLEALRTDKYKGIVLLKQYLGYKPYSIQNLFHEISIDPSIQGKQELFNIGLKYLCENGSSYDLLSMVKKFDNAKLVMSQENCEIFYQYHKSKNTLMELLDEHNQLEVVIYTLEKELVNRTLNQFVRHLYESQVNKRWISQVTIALELLETQNHKVILSHWTQGFSTYLDPRSLNIQLMNVIRTYIELDAPEMALRWLSKKVMDYGLSYSGAEYIEEYILTKKLHNQPNIEEEQILRYMHLFIYFKRTKFSSASKISLFNFPPSTYTLELHAKALASIKDKHPKSYVLNKVTKVADILKSVKSTELDMNQGVIHPLIHCPTLDFISNITKLPIPYVDLVMSNIPAHYKPFVFGPILIDLVMPYEVDFLVNMLDKYPEIGKSIQLTYSQSLTLIIGLLNQGYPELVDRLIRSEILTRQRQLKNSHYWDNIYLNMVSNNNPIPSIFHTISEMNLTESNSLNIRTFIAIYQNDWELANTLLKQSYDQDLAFEKSIAKIGRAVNEMLIKFNKPGLEIKELKQSLLSSKAYSTSKVIERKFDDLLLQASQFNGRPDIISKVYDYIKQAAIQNPKYNFNPRMLHSFLTSSQEPNEQLSKLAHHCIGKSNIVWKETLDYLTQKGITIKISDISNGTILLANTGKFIPEKTPEQLESMTKFVNKFLDNIIKLDPITTEETI